MRDLRATAHVTQNDKGRRSAIDGRTTRHTGYQVSVRKRIEEAFGWMKVIGGQRKIRNPQIPALARISGRSGVGKLRECRTVRGFFRSLLSGPRQTFQWPAPDIRQVVLCLGPVSS
jgi:hypothetical protein